MTSPERIPEGNYSSPRREFLGTCAAVTGVFAAPALLVGALLAAKDGGENNTNAIKEASVCLERSIANDDITDIVKHLVKLRDDGLLESTISMLRDNNIAMESTALQQRNTSWLGELRAKDFRTCVAMHSSKRAISVLSSAQLEGSLDSMLERLERGISDRGL